MTVNRPIRPAIALLLAALLAVSTTVLAASPTSAGTAGDEQRFIELINRTRAAAGLPALSVHPELTAQARAWASSMAANDQLAHSADISAGITAPWTVLGENVGVHGIRDVDQLYDAFVASPGHYANLVDGRYRYVGVGVVVTESGKLWTTHRFMATSEPAPTTTPPTTAPTTTAAPTTAAPTTVPPTTAAPTTIRPSTTSSTAGPSSTAPPSNPPPSTAPTGAEAGANSPAHTSPTSPPPDDGIDELAPGPVDGDDPPAEIVAPPIGPGPDDVDTVERLLDDLVVAGI